MSKAEEAANKAVDDVKKKGHGLRDSEYREMLELVIEELKMILAAMR